MIKWKMHVEGFGKIKEIDIEVGSFTMFVGDNNSGKSYLMELVWGIRYGAADAIWLEDTNLEKIESICNLSAYQNAVPIIENFYEEESIEKKMTISSQEMQILFELYNTLLELYKDEFISYLCMDKSVSLDKIEVSTVNSTEEVLVNRMDKDVLYQFVRTSIWKSNEIGNESLYDVSIKLVSLKFIMDEIFGSKYVYGGIEPKDIFFPASRTGIVLNYKILADYLFRPSHRDNSNKYESFTLPVYNFFQNINWISDEYETDEYAEIISFVEKNVISGKLSLGKSYSTEFFYTPESKQIEKLPMKLCSGVVTEVVLVILFLKHLGVSSITIEEPEMCLHPRLQWQYARAFIKMYNKGLPIMMATHSDIFMAQINNMIKLCNNPNKEKLMKEYGYEVDDLIEANDVKVYQFDVQQDGSTKVLEIKADEDGFHIPSFQKTLNELLQQSMAFEMEED